MSPLNKALKAKSPLHGWDLVWLRYAITLLSSQFSPDWLSLPVIWRVRSCLLHDGLIQIHFMLPHSHIESCFCSREVSLSRPFCGVSWLIFQSAIPGCQCHVYHHISYIGPLLVPVWEGPHWLLAGGSCPYRRRHLALRTGLEPHPGPIFIIDRSPCAQHRSVSWVFDWVVSLVFDISIHYHTLGFVQYLGFHLTLLVDTSPLCRLSLLVGSEGFCRALATSCVRRKRTSVGLLHLFRPIPSTLLAYGLHSR